MRSEYTTKKFGKLLYLLQSENNIFHILSIGTQRFAVAVVSVTPIGVGCYLFLTL